MPKAKSKKTAEKKPPAGTGMTRAQFRTYANKKISGGAKKNTFLDVTGVHPAHSSGILSLDRALGTNGLPHGRIVEIFGNESSGKTLTVFMAIIEAQRRHKLPCYFVDAEHAFDPAWFETLGGDLDLLDVLEDFSYSEPVWETIFAAAYSRQYAIVAVDSLVGMVPKAIMEKEMGKSGTLGVDAKVNKEAFRKCAIALSGGPTNMIVVNHVIEKIGVVFGNPEDTPGGKALKFYASQRIKVLPPGKEQKKEVDGDYVGHTVRGTVIKNKLAPPQRKFEYDIYFETGVDNIPPLLTAAQEVGIFESNTFTFPDDSEPLIFKSGRAVRERLHEDMVLLRKIWDVVLTLKKR